MSSNKIIIVFSGKQFSGKDTVAKFLLSEFSSFRRIGIADAIKHRYSLSTGLSLEEIDHLKDEDFEEHLDFLEDEAELDEEIMKKLMGE